MNDIHASLHNVRNCICSECVSFPGKWRELAHAEMPGLFCGHGRSKLEIERLGCICGSCLVQQENGLDGLYYCIEGKTAG
jgi:hypothetical protein